MRPAVLVVFALLAQVPTSPSNVTVTVDRNAGSAATPSFKFEHVASPSTDDAGAKAKVAIVDGVADVYGGAASWVNDGLLPRDEDEPGSNFFFNSGTGGGRLVFDLGAVVDVAQVNSYSWHPSTRGRQMYTLYGGDGTGPAWNAAPTAVVDPESVGWKKITVVDTVAQGGEEGGQYGVSVSAKSGTLGKFRYLLFDVLVTETRDDYGNTFYSEIDVIAARASAADVASAQAIYTTNEKHDPDGIGKFYFGREIAHVMGHQAASWLERPDREETELPQRVVDEMKLPTTAIVADVGAGTGYFTFRLSRAVPQGTVYAVDIQPEMLAIIDRRKTEQHVSNVVTVRGSESDTKLPAASVDVALLVDAYHEFEFPREMMESIVRSLKPGGRVVLIEYRAEDPDVPIKPVHKMTVDQAKKELTAVGLVYKETKEFLPQQHFIVFGKKN